MIDTCDECGHIFTENEALHHYNDGALLLCDDCRKKLEIIEKPPS